MRSANRRSASRSCAGSSTVGSDRANAAIRSRVWEISWLAGFTRDNFQHNLRIVGEVEKIAAEIGATPAQVAIAWLLAKGDDIAPIPGTKRVERVEENIAADNVELSTEQLDKLDDLTPPAGDHHNEAQMRMIDR
jgi:aryl-alcohol dehydrogenase-like predicted oxidoreductase